MDADGGEILRLTDDSAMDREESRSPDSGKFLGRFIDPSWRSNEEVAFIRPSVKTDVQYATAADGSGPLRRIENREKEQEEQEEKVASPDGTEKAYFCDQDESVGWEQDDEVGEDFRICVEETSGDTVPEELRGRRGAGTISSGRRMGGVSPSRPLIQRQMSSSRASRDLTCATSTLRIAPVPFG